MNRMIVIQSIINRIKAQNYLEIGISKGHNFLTVKAPQKIGVDPLNQLRRHSFGSLDGLNLEYKKLVGWSKQLFQRERSRFFELTSDDFFSRIPHLFSGNKIDVAFVDGLHTYDQALRDVLNCLTYINQGGVIVLHDCNPANAAMAAPTKTFEEAKNLNLPGWDGLWCGDVWKTIVYLRSIHKELQVFVLDCDMGIGVVAQGKPETTLSFSRDEIDRLTYEDLAKNREKFLNLKPPSYLKNFLSQLPQNV